MRRSSACGSAPGAISISKMLGFTWADALHTQAYTVQNIGHLVGEVLAARGACNAGLTWHYARPPVIDLEFEMDVRAAAREIIL